jgi:hypothetical protein
MEQLNFGEKAAENNPDLLTPNSKLSYLQPAKSLTNYAFV